LGPVLEQLNQDLLDPLIDIAFNLMARQGILPEAPEELQGVPLKVEYVSAMAQAQKLVSIGGIERFGGFVSQLAEVHPEALDKVDFDQTIDEYGDMVSVPQGVVRSDDDVAAIRAERAKQQQAAQAAESMKALAGGARDLSQTPLDGNTALNAVLEQSNAGNLVPQQ